LSHSTLGSTAGTPGPAPKIAGAALRKVIRDSLGIEGWDSIYREEHEEARKQLNMQIYGSDRIRAGMRPVGVGVRHE